MTIKESGLSWRLQDAKAQFSAVVEGALRGVPQHVTRRGKQAVVVLSEQDFAAMRSGAARQGRSFIEHLRAMPKEPAGVQATKQRNATPARAKLALRDLEL